MENETNATPEDEIIEELQKSSGEATASADTDSDGDSAFDDVDYTSEIAQLNQKISELEHKNEVIAREYRRLYKKTKIGVKPSDNHHKMGYNVDDIIKSTYRGVFNGSH